MHGNLDNRAGPWSRREGRPFRILPAAALLAGILAIAALALLISGLFLLVALPVAAAARAWIAWRARRARPSVGRAPCRERVIDI